MTFYSHRQPRALPNSSNFCIDAGLTDGIEIALPEVERVMTHMGANSKRMSKSDISYAVLAYLVENPDAQDTLDGILRWWLLEQKLKIETARVKRSLDELVAKGLILETSNSATGVLYRVNRGKFDEIRTVLSRISDNV